MSESTTTRPAGWCAFLGATAACTLHPARPAPGATYNPREPSSRNHHRARQCPALRRAFEPSLAPNDFVHPTPRTRHLGARHASEMTTVLSSPPSGAANRTRHRTCPGVLRASAPTVGFRSVQRSGQQPGRVRVRAARVSATSPASITTRGRRPDGSSTINAQIWLLPRQAHGARWFIAGGGHRAAEPRPRLGDLPRFEGKKVGSFRAAGPAKAHTHLPSGRPQLPRTRLRIPARRSACSRRLRQSGTGPRWRRTASSSGFSRRSIAPGFRYCTRSDTPASRRCRRHPPFDLARTVPTRRVGTARAHRSASPPPVQTGPRFPTPDTPVEVACDFSHELSGAPMIHHREERHVIHSPAAASPRDAPNANRAPPRHAAVGRGRALFNGVDRPSTPALGRSPAHVLSHPRGEVLRPKRSPPGLRWIGVDRRPQTSLFYADSASSSAPDGIGPGRRHRKPWRQDPRSVGGAGQSRPPKTPLDDGSRAAPLRSPTATRHPSRALTAGNGRYLAPGRVSGPMGDMLPCQRRRPPPRPGWRVSRPPRSAGGPGAARAGPRCTVPCAPPTKIRLPSRGGGGGASAIERARRRPIDGRRRRTASCGAAPGPPFARGARRPMRARGALIPLSPTGRRRCSQERFHAPTPG